MWGLRRRKRTRMFTYIREKQCASFAINKRTWVSPSSGRVMQYPKPYEGWEPWCGQKIVKAQEHDFVAPLGRPSGHGRCTGSIWSRRAERGNNVVISICYGYYGFLEEYRIPRVL